MTGNNKSTILPINKKACLLGIIVFFSFLIILGIGTVYAYYTNTTPFSIFANLVGDFDSGDGDVNMIIYQESGVGTNVYTKVYGIPSYGYKFDSTLNRCTSPCDNDPTVSCPINCGTDSTSSCYYTYDETTNNISITSNKKVSCKFYFKSLAESDAAIYVMKEDASGTKTYNSKKYTQIDFVPAYGFTYMGYQCDNGAIVTYNTETKKFSISATAQNKCYVYFDKTNDLDLDVIVYVQSEKDSMVYNKVESIPANNNYILSTQKTSNCVNSNGNITDATITYENGYINILTKEKQSCTVYLDLSEE